MDKKSSRGKKAVEKRKVKSRPEQKLPEDPALREIIVGIVGEHGYGIAKEFVEGERIAEEVAKERGIPMNLVRKVLYDLYDNRVAGYRRAMDKYSGWYVYYWRIDPERAIEYFKDNKRMLLQKLEQRLEAERSTNFFSCEKGDPKLSFDLAVENEFKCPRCGGRLEPYDNSNVITAIERKIGLLRQSLVDGHF